MLLALLAGGYLITHGVAMAAERSATVINFEGVVDVKKTGTTQWIPVEKGMALGSGDVVRTTIDSLVDLGLDDGGALRLDEETEMTIEALTSSKERARFMMFFDRPVEAQKAKLKLAQGKVLASLKKLPSSQSMFQVETPTGVAGVRGTTWGVETGKMKGENGQLTQSNIVDVQQGAAWVSENDTKASGIDATLQPFQDFINMLFKGGKAFGETGGAGGGPGSTLKTFVPEFTRFKNGQLSPLPEEFVEETADLTKAAARENVVLDPTPVTVADNHNYIEHTITPSLDAPGGSITDPGGVQQVGSDPGPTGPAAQTKDDTKPPPPPPPSHICPPDC